MCSVEVGKVVANSSISCFINEIHRTFSDNYCVKVELNTNYVGIKCQLDATEVFIAVLIACSICLDVKLAVNIVTTGIQRVKSLL